MSLLSDGSIEYMLQTRDSGLSVTPPVANEAIQPASLDVRLGGTMLHQTRSGYSIRPGYRNVPEFDTWEDHQFTLYPGEFYLGTTLEHFKLGPRTALKLEGKSSWGRCGLEVHSTAGWIDPGFYGQITLEMKVVGVDPVTVKLGDYIAQVCVFWMDFAAVKPYNGKYNGQTGPAGPR